MLTYQDKSLLSRMYLVSGLVLQGEVWRVLTFLAVPPSFSPIFIFFALYLFYIYGTSLREVWGEMKLSLFFLIGYLLTVAASFVFPFQVFNNYYILSSFFLAFAVINPDFEIRLFFILPVKVKWLALLTWIWFSYLVVMGPMYQKAQVLAAVANFGVFFAGDVFYYLKNRSRQAAWKAQQLEPDRKYFHKCSVCGKTDVDSPTELFRYKEVSGKSQCFCEEHV